MRATLTVTASTKLVCSTGNYGTGTKSWVSHLESKFQYNIQKIRELIGF